MPYPAAEPAIDLLIRKYGHVWNIPPANAAIDMIRDLHRRCGNLGSLPGQRRRDCRRFAPFGYFVAGATLAWGCLFYSGGVSLWTIAAIIVVAAATARAVASASLIVAGA